MRVALYCRISTEDQQLDSQELICRSYCERSGYEVYKVYKDVISGAKSNRPAFNQLLEDMRAKQFDIIMVSKLDRLGRSLQHLLSLFDEFNKRHVSFIAATQNIDTTTAAGRLQLQIIGAFAEFERNIISERTKEGLKVASGVGKRGKDKLPRKRRGVAKKESVYDDMLKGDALRKDGRL